MTPPNVNTLWGRLIVDELAKGGVEAAVLSPGSRSTPLTVAFANHSSIETFTHLDERAAAFFALGRAKRTGRPTPLVCTSGTAVANYHPAVVEGDRGRVPMLLLTADRPPELTDSGANQTIEQAGIFADATRHTRTLPEPEVADRKLRAVRTAVARAVATSEGTHPGPVHLNVPFRKPLEPTVTTEGVSDAWIDEHRLAATGRDEPYVRTTQGRPTLAAADRAALAEAVNGAERGLIVCGPADAPTPVRDALAELATATGFPVLADPLSGIRFGHHVPEATVLGGYDAWGPALGDTLPVPEVVLRFGASPTSKPLRKTLAATTLDAPAAAPRQFVIDPASGWREAEFTATDAVVADPNRLAGALADSISNGTSAYADRLADVESRYWSVVAEEDRFFEGQVLRDVADVTPARATLFVSNSMPVRDLDRFAEPRAGDLTVLGNRGASGIDGITSTALGAGSAADGPLVCVTGDLAYLHDTNGLLAVDRFGLDATIVLINNDGGGIFHLLPIEDHETFEGYFRTPHGLDFAPTGALHDLGFTRVTSREGMREAFAASIDADGTQVIEVGFDATESHAVRDALQSRVEATLGITS